MASSSEASAGDPVRSTRCGAIIVNPYDIEGVGDSLARALSMPLAERCERWEAMFKRLSRYDLAAWRDSFMTNLDAAPCAAAAA